MSGTISRRGFVRDVIRGLIAGIAVALPLAKTVTSAESPDVTLSSDNWWAFQQEIKRLAQDYTITSFALKAEENGYRRVRVDVVDDQPLTWQQPWCKAAHIRANIHYDFRTCDCGAKTLTPHQQTCSRATHLAWKLGPDLEGFRD